MKNEVLWNQNYELAKQYYEENGDLNIPQDYVVNGVRLGVWIHTQRRIYKGQLTSHLTPGHIQKLNDVGMIWDVYEDSWNQNYELAKQYYEEHGNLDIDRDYIVNGVRLGNWIVSCRGAKRGKRSRQITEKQIQKLNAIGMEWEPFEANWNQNYKLAKQYYEENGNLNIPQDYVVDGMPLGDWISTQRQVKSGTKRGNLTSERVQKLDEIGMIWNVKEANWNDRYQLAKQYYEEHKNLDIPCDYVIDGVNMGAWISTQRLAKKGIGSAVLTEDRIAKLNEIGMIWQKANGTPLVYQEFSSKSKYYIRRQLLTKLKDTLSQFDQERQFTSIEDIKEIEKEFLKKLK